MELEKFSFKYWPFKESFGSTTKHEANVHVALVRWVLVKESRTGRIESASLSPNVMLFFGALLSDSQCLKVFCLMISN